MPTLRFAHFAPTSLRARGWYGRCIALLSTTRPVKERQYVAGDFYARLHRIRFSDHPRHGVARQLRLECANLDGPRLERDRNRQTRALLDKRRPQYGADDRADEEVSASSKRDGSTLLRGLFLGQSRQVSVRARL